ncbi:hypothetical protein PCANC_03236 [Puccinia coronata f. sp. avenae]|uniref:RING-type domain-containing protein n=1 Tax=Puccinia coronata f. sp. avenae TaxID=200324 RepID=A0A2N5VYZ4_9BASI|nr:hypothetical protein PCASD_12711 [Puccinia coronata f. sp. avenae]PLW55208.1 hypothetical protein PCANC_03236 [Puccinia coronata f. sp. avenae]
MELEASAMLIAVIVVIISRSISQPSHADGIYSHHARRALIKYPTSHADASSHSGLILEDEEEEGHEHSALVDLSLSDSEIEPELDYPHHPLQSQNWREYPRRTVDWSQFKTLYYSAQRDSAPQVAIDIIEGSGRGRQSKGEIAAVAAEGGRMKKLRHSISERIARRAGSRKGKEVQLKKAEPIEVGPEDGCMIYLEVYSTEREEEATMIAVFPTCKHLFHRECLRKWFDKFPTPTDHQNHDTPCLLKHSLLCPICRRPAPTTNHLAFITQLLKYHLPSITQLLKYHLPSIMEAFACLILIRLIIFFMDIALHAH